MALGGISGTTHSGTKKCRFSHAELCIFLTSHLEGSQTLLSDGSRQDSTLSRLLHDIQILLILLLAAISCIFFYLFLPGTCRCHKCPTQMPAWGLPQWMWGVGTAKKWSEGNFFGFIILHFHPLSTNSHVLLTCVFLTTLRNTFKANSVRTMYIERLQWSTKWQR